MPARGVRLRTPGSVAPLKHCRSRREYVLMRTTSIAAYTAIADSFGTDRADRTRGDESLRSTSGCAVRRRAPNGRRCPASPRSSRPANPSWRARRAESPRPAQAALLAKQEIGRSKASAASSYQCVRVASNQLGRFMPPDACRLESATTRRGSERVSSGGRFPARSAGGGRNGASSAPHESSNGSQDSGGRSKGCKGRTAVSAPG
jgi:hypothetical protein